MKSLVWLIRIAIFIVFFLLTLANTQKATLYFLGGYAWHAPLILIGIGFLVAGIITGLFATLPKLFRQRRAINQYKRQIKMLNQITAQSAAKNKDVVISPPMP